jgi:broad specificity phosphatase PhoE
MSMEALTAHGMSPISARIEAPFAGLQATADTRLLEFDFEELEGAAWNQLTPTHRGESVTELKARVHSFLSDLDGGRHIIVTHGGVIRLICRELGRDRHIGPGTVTKLTSFSPRS